LGLHLTGEKEEEEEEGAVAAAAEEEERNWEDFSFKSLKNPVSCL
jgi:hypothetical protein